MEHQRRAHQGEIPEFSRRYRYLVAVVFLVFAGLVARLWYLQVIGGEHYRASTKDNFIKQKRLVTIRGDIRDRKNRVLATNRPSFDVYALPAEVSEESLRLFLDEVVTDQGERARLAERLSRARIENLKQRILLRRDISRDHVAKMATHRLALAGFTLVSRSLRHYPYGSAAAHVLGYLNEVSADDLAGKNSGLYRPGDRIGRSGVERRYERYLRGVPGVARTVIDARGRKLLAAAERRAVETPIQIPAQSGRTLILTLDIDLQRDVESALSAYPSAAAVVLEAETGRILASASQPAFDPNMMSARLSAAQAERLIADPHRPLLDKVYRENYFPGSTFKVVTAAAILETGLFDPEETIECEGVYRFGRRRFHCSHVHGKTNLDQAIVRSCNVYFYRVAELLGMDRIARYAQEFGLGAGTGLALNGEVSGLIPTKAWYRRHGLVFRNGYTLNASIGQGNVKATPIQMAALYAAIGNGGRLYAPQILAELEADADGSAERFAPRIRRRLNLKPDTLRRLQVALKGVVNRNDGTAYKIRADWPTFAGKTGTAQVVRRGDNKEYSRRDHSWFAGYAPAEKPEIAFAVLIEHGGHAAKVAVPVAMQIVRRYFAHRGRATQ